MRNIKRLQFYFFVFCSTQTTVATIFSHIKTYAKYEIITIFNKFGKYTK